MHYTAIARIEKPCPPVSTACRIAFRIEWKGGARVAISGAYLYYARSRRERGSKRRKKKRKRGRKRTGKERLARAAAKTTKGRERRLLGESSYRERRGSRCLKLRWRRTRQSTRDPRVSLRTSAFFFFKRTRLEKRDSNISQAIILRDEKFGFHIM